MEHKTKEELLEEVGVLKKRISELETIISTHSSEIQIREADWLPNKNHPNVNNIKELELAKNSVAASEAKFRSLFESMTEGVAIHELIFDGNNQPIDYRITDVNPSFGKQLNIPIDIAKNALASQLYKSNPAPYLEEYTGVATTGEPYFFETYFPPMDKHFEISVFSPRKNWFATVFLDITTRKKAEEKMQNLNDELEVKVAEKTEELQARISELERFQNATIDRELRMKELRDTIEILEKKLEEKK